MARLRDGGLDARGDIDCIPQDGDLFAFHRSNRTRNDPSTVDSRSHLNGGFRAPFLIQIIQATAHFQRHLDRTARMIFLWIGRPEYGHDAVPDELVESPVVLEDGIGHAGEVLVE